MGHERGRGGGGDRRSGWGELGGRNWRHRGCDVPTGQRELSPVLIRGPSGLSGVFLVIHLFFGLAAPQQVGGAGEWLREHGAYETN